MPEIPSRPVITSSSKTGNRRSFLKKGIVTGVAGAGLAALGNKSLFAQTFSEGAQSSKLSKGDAALLRFAAAAEILEADFWIQYNELGGIQDDEVPGGSGNPEYTEKLEAIDDDFPQYIHDNTDDEITHYKFLNAYLQAKGASPANLDQFRTLQGSTATGSSGKPRLTNLLQLTIDTSWYTRYRDAFHNPDLDSHFTFPQAVKALNSGQWAAIPKTDDHLTPDDHLKAIASTAAFHMPTIEQGGNSLYPSLAQRASSVEVLRILISIGPTETMHFQTWSDLAADVVQPPFAPLTDPVTGLVFPNLEDTTNELFEPPLIMPEPCPFISRALPKCSVIRPTETKGAAMGAVKFLSAMGLFIGQSDQFFEMMKDLASEADAARRGF